VVDSPFSYTDENGNFRFTIHRYYPPAVVPSPDTLTIMVAAAAADRKYPMPDYPRATSDSVAVTVTFALRYGSSYPFPESLTPLRRNLVIPAGGDPSGSGRLHSNGNPFLRRNYAASQYSPRRPSNPADPEASDEWNVEAAVRHGERSGVVAGPREADPVPLKPPAARSGAKLRTSMVPR
jgi:hypothetical protein